jgi:uncharacterized protein (TIGR00255 family)
MTGYGRGTVERDGTRAGVEISAVNRRQADIRIVLPKELASQEPLLRARVQKAISRGCLTVSVSYDLSPECRREQVQVDMAVAAHVVGKLRQLARTIGISDHLTLADLVSLPGIVTAADDQGPMALLQDLVLAALDKALSELKRMQAEEGAALEQDLRGRCGRLAEMIARIRQDEQEVVRQYRDRLRKRIALLGLDLSVDDERLAKEVAFLAERSDIAEETVRLSSHLDQMRELLAATEPVGRALEFLCQEMGREINTMAAKTCDTAVADLALQFKNELGRIREQVCNVE